MTELSPTPRSPRLARIAVAVAGADDAAARAEVAALWAEVDGRGPLVEPIDGDPAHRLVTFLWRGDGSTRSVELSDAIWPSFGRVELTPIATTGIWHLSRRLPHDHRGTYTYAVLDDGVSEPRTAIDATNPAVFDGESLLELPDAPAQPWIRERDGVPRGRTVAATVASAILGEDRPVTVHIPAGHDPAGEATGVLVLSDGEWYGSREDSLIPTPLILDNLVSAGRIPPLVAILVDHVSTTQRMRDLACHAPFADFLATELLPWAREHWAAGTDPARTILGGASLGGLTAAYTALRHPAAFGNVLSQDGSFWWYPGWSEPDEYFWPDVPEGWLPGEVARLDPMPIRMYLEAGRYAWTTQLPSNRQMRLALEIKGYPVTYSEYAGGHEKACWRGSLATGLISLADQWPAGR